jgi:hypothetical protein
MLFEKYQLAYQKKIEDNPGITILLVLTGNLERGNSCTENS